MAQYAENQKVAVKAVLFDMDGLMIDTERISAKAWTTAGKEAGLVIDETWLSTIRGTSKEEACEKFLAFYGQDKDFWGLRKRKNELITEELAKNGIPVKTGLYELLEFLKKNGIHVALATATQEETALGYLREIGVLPYFEAFACGNMVKHCKPDPELFLLAASKLGYEPKDCMVLEDSLQGIEAAYRGGFLPVMVPDITMPTEDTERKLYAKCENLNQVMDLIWVEPTK